jgi:hypothetical protein
LTNIEWSQAWKEMLDTKAALEKDLEQVKQLHKMDMQDVISLLLCSMVSQAEQLAVGGQIPHQHGGQQISRDGNVVAQIGRIENVPQADHVQKGVQSDRG